MPRGIPRFVSLFILRNEIHSAPLWNHGNHSLLACAGEPSLWGFLAGAGFRPSTVLRLNMLMKEPLPIWSTGFLICISSAPNPLLAKQTHNRTRGNCKQFCEEAVIQVLTLRVSPSLLCDVVTAGYTDGHRGTIADSPGGEHRGYPR